MTAAQTDDELTRLRAENATLTKALRYAHDSFVCSSTCHRTEPAVCDVLAATTKGQRGQANLPAVLAGLVLAVGAMWLVGWVGDHAAAGAHVLACVTRAIGG